MLHVNWCVCNPHYRTQQQLYVLPFYQRTLTPLCTGLMGKPQLQTINDGKFASQPYIPAIHPYGGVDIL